MPPLPPACGLGALPASGWAPFPWIPAGAPRGVHRVPRMVAFFVSILQGAVLVLRQLMACSLQHSAADIGAGAWVREGSIEFAAFVAKLNNPARPPSRGFIRSSVPAFSSCVLQQLGSRRRRRLLDWGGQYLFGLLSIALRYTSSAAPIFGARDSR